MACARHGQDGDIYNLGSGVETTIKELAERINDLTGNQTPVDLKPPRDWDRSGQRFADTAKSKEMLGFEAQVSHEEGIRRTVAWTQENRDTILHCMLKHKKYVPDVIKYQV